jgi:hypothetical protein
MFIIIIIIMYFFAEFPPLPPEFFDQKSSHEPFFPGTRVNEEI